LAGAPTIENPCKDARYASTQREGRDSNAETVKAA
jgi:hypothetical protein